MDAKRRKRFAAAAVAAVAALILAGLIWQRSRISAGPEALIARTPSRDAVVVYIDFAALRRTGVLELLAGSQVAQDPEYRGFVASTGFDYGRDLDAAVVSFTPSGKYIAARGRFDWDHLRAYAAQSGGDCRDGFCRMSGSSPERNISWLPLASNLIGLAVSRDDRAAESMRRPDPGASPFEIPREPVWIALPPSALRSPGDLPSGTRLLARTLENADRVILTLGEEKQRFALKMDVRCRSAEDARDLAKAMERTTGMLRDMIAREKQAPNPRDLSGVLTAGAFAAEGSRMRGYWPVERAFFEELLRPAGSS